MSVGRVLIALLLTATWFATVWHSDLEAVGWMMDHDHGHAEDGAAHHVPFADVDHEPVFARHTAQDAFVLSVPAFVALFGLPALGLLMWLGLQWRPRVMQAWMIPRTWDDDSSTSWRFLWRCAPDSAAPPVLS